MYAFFCTNRLFSRWKVSGKSVSRSIWKLSITPGTLAGFFDRFDYKQKTAVPVFRRRNNFLVIYVPQKTKNHFRIRKNPFYSWVPLMHCIHKQSDWLEQILPIYCLIIYVLPNTLYLHIDMKRYRQLRVLILHNLYWIVFTYWIVCKVK